MGLFNDDKLSLIYNAIKSKAIFNVISTFIVVAPDVDSLASAKLLTDLLRNDSILYRLVPINRPDMLSKIKSDYIVGDKNLRNIILINCGGGLDIYRIFETSKDIQVYIFDSHRPYNLHNVYNYTSIKVIGNDENITPELSSAYRVVYLNEYDMDLVVSGDEADSDDELAGDDPVKAERKRQKKRELRKKIRKDSYNLIKRYESSGVEYGMSVSCLMLTMAEGQGALKDDYLWWASIGLTSRFISNQHSRDQYLMHYDWFQRKLENHNIEMYPNKKRPSGPITKNVTVAFDNNTLRGRVMNRRIQRNSGTKAVSEVHFDPNVTFVSAENAIKKLRKDKPEDPTNDRELFNILSAPMPTPSPLPIEDNSKDSHLYQRNKLDVEGRVELKEAFIFPTLHYWNLYESMRYSNEISTNFRVWTEAGRSRMHNILAKMGVSLSQSCLFYPTMDRDIKVSLMNKLNGYAPQYGLRNLTYPSICRHMGYNTILPLEAADVCASIEALLKVTPTMLERLTELNREIVLRTVLYDGDTQLKLDATNKVAPEVLETLKKGFEKWDGDETDLDGIYQQCFSIAYSAFDNIKLLKAGINLSIHIKKGIMEEGFKLLKDNDVCEFDAYRLAFVKESPRAETYIHPDTLADLGHFLSQAIKRSSRDGSDKGKSLPIVTASLDKSSNRFLVVAVRDFTTFTRDPIALAFKQQANDPKVKLQFARFKNSVIEVNQDDFGIFLTNLNIRVKEIESR
ncbi:CDC45-like protein [Neoconidiobolus thromboides FSU 785]|nr:CDC45-like protein [Neoconidiobolus thromboides FSU 785]